MIAAIIAWRARDCHAEAVSHGGEIRPACPSDRQESAERKQSDAKSSQPRDQRQQLAELARAAPAAFARLSTAAAVAPRTTNCAAVRLHMAVGVAEGCSSPRLLASGGGRAPDRSICCCMQPPRARGQVTRALRAPLAPARPQPPRRKRLTNTSRADGHAAAGVRASAGCAAGARQGGRQHCCAWAIGHACMHARLAHATSVLLRAVRCVHACMTSTCMRARSCACARMLPGRRRLHARPGSFADACVRRLSMHRTTAQCTVRAASGA